MADFDFIGVNAADIYAEVMQQLMDGAGEPLYPGDERRIFGEALAAVLVAAYSKANDIAKQKMLKYARGTVLDAMGERVGAARLESTSASATFRFGVEAPRDSNIIIPQGTRITADGSIYFATDSIAVLQAGSTYVDVTAHCLTAGAAYNGYLAGSIATMVDVIPYISSVKNTTVSAGGDDGEPYTDEGDDRYRERILLAPYAQTTAGPIKSYTYHALSADPDIIDVYVTSPKACEVEIYPLMKGGALPDEETLAKVLAAVNADDVRPMTDKVTTKAPTAQTYDIELKYYCSMDDEADVVTTVESDGGAIAQYVAWQCEKLGRDINPDQLRRYILCPDFMTNGKGAKRVDIVKPTFTELSGSQIAKFSGSLNVTHVIEED